MTISTGKTTPRAVLIADVHFSLNTLQLADAAMRQAIAHADKLHVPLIVAGDLHDTKGAMRAECVKAMMATLSSRSLKHPCYVMVGNHDRINEKGKEHSLEFLHPLVSVVNHPVCLHGLWMIPYEHDPEALKATLEGLTPGSTLIMHTGVQTAYMGHYTQDKSSLPPEAFAPFRVISGHYHRRQDVGTVSYIGSPYTLNFGEALDPPKGFQVLNTDGSLTFVPTNLRKHIVLDRNLDTLLDPVPEYNPGDLVKIKVTGPKSELEKISRKTIGNTLFGHSNFVLDLKPLADAKVAPTAAPVDTTLDALIDGMQETDTQKQALKALWRSLV